MIPASNKAFVVNNLVSGTGYDLCVLAMWDDTATTLTATNIVGCAQFFTKADYPQCQSMHSQILGGTMILVIGGIIVATLLVFLFKNTASESLFWKFSFNKPDQISLGNPAVSQAILLFHLDFPYLY